MPQGGRGRAPGPRAINVPKHLETLYYPVRTWAATDRIIVVDKNMKYKTLESYDDWQRMNPVSRAESTAAGGPCPDLLNRLGREITIDSSPGGNLHTVTDGRHDKVMSEQMLLRMRCMPRTPDQDSHLKTTAEVKERSELRHRDSEVSEDDLPIIRRTRVRSPSLGHLQPWERRLMVASPIPADDMDYDTLQSVTPVRQSTKEENDAHNAHPTPSEQHSAPEDEEHTPIPTDGEGDDEEPDLWTLN